MSPTKPLKVKPDLTPKNVVPEVKKEESPTIDLQPVKHHPWRRVLITLGIAVVVCVGIVGAKFYLVSSKVIAHDANSSFLSQVKNLISAPDKQLQGEDQERVNILLMGFGGAGHDGAYLTDTMIVASFNTTTKQVAMISIPRDLYVSIPGYGYRKINNAYAFGHQDNPPDGGAALAESVVQETLGIPIHYYAWIDFSGFAKIIDDIGGVDINVQHPFVDYEYPTENYGYQTIRFTVGVEHMAGARALMYVRSRHGTNGEGSDFARSRRQQEVLAAVKEKLTSIGVLSNPTKISEILDTLSTHVKTNMQLWELARVEKLFGSIDQTNIVNRTFDTSTLGLLMSSTTQDGAYILRPKSGSFTDMQYVVNHVFELDAIAKEKATVKLVDATNKKGYGQTAASTLASMSIDVGTVMTAAKEDTTVIYDVSNGTKPLTLAALQKRFNGTIQTQLPESLSKKFPSADPLPDIVVELGIDVLPQKAVGGPVATLDTTHVKTN